MSADLNPLGPPPGLPGWVTEAQGEVRWYPDPAYRDFREAAGEAEGVTPESILPGNGTADLIHLIARGPAGRRAAVVVPTFIEYERAVRAGGGRVTPWHLREEEGFRAPDRFPTRDLAQAQVLFLCNPNNPTGTLWGREPLERLLGPCRRRGIWMVVDEAYMELVADGGRFSASGWVRRWPNLVVLRSLTKAFSVPGLRIGYVVAAPAVIRKLGLLQPPWPMNTLAARVGVRLLRERDFLRRSRERIALWRAALRDGLEGQGRLQPHPSEANFLLCRVAGRRARATARGLGERGILVRVCDDFTGLRRGEFLRVAVRTPGENARLLAALKILPDTKCVRSVSGRKCGSFDPHRGSDG